MSPSGIPNPLTQEHLDAINTGLRAVHDVNGLIARAQACGMDCSAHQAMANYYQQQLSAVKAHFFPKGKA